MSKKINSNSFKTVAVALFAFAALLANSAAWGQTNITVPAKLNDGSLAIATRTCPLLSPQNPLNNVTTTNVVPATGDKARLGYMNTSGLTFSIPIDGQKVVSVTSSGATFAPCTITAADVDRFFDMVYLNAGYTKLAGSTASMSMNCHGYSTGKNVWLQQFSATQKQVDYTERTKAGYLVDMTGAAAGTPKTGDVVIAASSDHSVLATAEGSIKSNGEIEYKVVSTKEKFNASAVYTKTINLPPFAGTDDFSTVVMKDIVSEATSSGQATVQFTMGTVTQFYRKK